MKRSPSKFSDLLLLGLVKAVVGTAVASALLAPGAQAATHTGPDTSGLGDTAPICSGLC